MTRKPFDPNLVSVPPAERPVDVRGPLTVSRLTAMVKHALESALPGTLHVIGEISNFKRHGSGHLYLTLKDQFSELSCVMWRSSAARLKFSPADGLEVIATGVVEVFERAGRYQFYIRKLEPRGVGALELAFQQLCEKLDGEGLFDPGRKRPLPEYPSRIVLITSPTGAAVSDMLRTIGRRYPYVDVLVYPVRVQGTGAADEIARAIRVVNDNFADLGGVDLMIVGRGGGSLEDLWAFNEERVARAIYASTIPIVSAVGHEVDVTIADLVADVRAATPTAAAEMAVPVLDEVLADLAGWTSRLVRAVGGKVETGSARLEGLARRAALREPFALVHRREQVIDMVSNRLWRSLAERITSQRRRLDSVAPVLRRIAPDAFLLRMALKLGDVEHRLRWSGSRRLTRAAAGIEEKVGRLRRVSASATVRPFARRLERIAYALPVSMRHRLSSAKARLQRKEEVLQALSYKGVLGRGFSITRTKKGGRVVRTIAQVRDDERLVTEVTDGRFESDVVNVTQLELFD